MEWLRCMKHFDSTISTDQIRGLRRFSSLLNSSECLQELEYAEEQNIVCINTIFENFNSVLVKMSIWARTKEGRVTVPSEICSNMNSELRKIFIKLMVRVREIKTQISAKKLLSALNQIFGCEYLRKKFGIMYYINIVPDLVRNRTYWGEIPSDGWKDLITISIAAYNEELFGLEKPKVAKCIAHIISQGSLNSDLSKWIITKYNFMLSAVVNADFESTHAAECIMMMALSFSAKICKENREIACKFGEEVMEAVLKFYNPMILETVMIKSLVLEFLILQIQIHNPNGAIKGSKIAYAHDYQKWDGALSQMFLLIQEEVRLLIQRIQVFNSQEPLLGRFLEFSVAVSYQVMNLPQQSLPAGKKDVDLDSISSKRTGFQIILELLKNLPEHITGYWLYITSILIKKHGCIDESSYINMLDYLCHFTSLKRDSVTLDCFFRCCSSFAEVRMPSTCDLLDYMHGWKKIYSLSVWAIGLSQCEFVAYDTLCIVLATKPIPQKDMSELLEMYLTGHILPSDGSIKLFHTILLSFNIVDNMDLVTRQRCFSWIYPVKEKHQAYQDKQTVELIADVLVQLCLKGSIKKVQPKQSVSKGGPLEDFYSKLNFCDGLLVPETTPSSETSIVLPNEIPLEEVYFNMLIGMVIKDGESIISWVNQLIQSLPDTVALCRGAEFMSSHLQVVMLVASNLITWGVCSPTTVETTGFLCVFKKMLESLTDLLEALRKSLCSSQEWSKIFSIILQLYERHVDKQIAIFLRENTPQKFITMVISDLKERTDKMKNRLNPQYIRRTPDKYYSGTSLNSTDYYSLLDSQIYSGSTVLICVECKIMGAFCCNNGSSYLPQQKQIMIDFLSFIPKETMETEFPLWVQMLMAFLYLPINRMALDLEFLSVILKQAEDMMSTHINDVELIQIFLTLLEELAQKGLSNASIQGRVVESSEFYLKKLHDGIVDKKHPPSLTVKIVRLLGSFIKINPDLTWPSLHSPSMEQISARELLFQEICSPYAEVAVAVIEYLFLLLHPLKFVYNSEQHHNLNLWLKNITSFCLEERAMSVEDHRRGNISRISMHCLCIIAVATPLFQKTAIYQIITLMVHYQLDKGFCKQIIDWVAKEIQTDRKMLLADCLPYLIEKWVIMNDFKEFPYWLMDNKIDEFYSKNKSVIFSTLWMANHASLDDFCRISGNNSSGMLKDHSALVIAASLSKCLKSGNDEGQAFKWKSAYCGFEQLMKDHPDINLYEVVSTKKNSLLYQVFNCFHDEAKAAAIAGDSILHNCKSKISYPSRSNYNYTKEMLDESLEYLAHWNKEPAGLMYTDYLVMVSPSHLRVVLLLLSRDVINALTPCDALSRLISFQCYIEFVMECVAKAEKTTRDSLFIKKLCQGLFRDISFSFIRIIKRWSTSEYDILCPLGFVFLNNLLEHFAPFLKGLQVVLVPLFYALVDLIQDNSVRIFEDHVLKLIESLIESEFLKDDLRYLVHLPQTPTFSKINFVLKKLCEESGVNSLRMDLECFLSAYHTFGFTRIEMFQHVELMLKEKKVEFKALNDEIQKKSRSFSNYKDSVLHRTICLLSKLYTTSSHEERIAAGKCLAELGPHDMKVEVLIPEVTLSNTIRSTSDEKRQLYSLTFKCLELLPKYLLDPSIEVAEATSTALEAIMRSIEGDVTLREQWPCQLSLAEDYTIKENSIPPPPLEINEVAFCETYKLWVPSADCSYFKWITELLTALLLCFSSRASYFKDLIQICNLKVNFSEEILPFVMEIFFHCGVVSCQETLYKGICHFFQEVYVKIGRMTGFFPLQGAKVITLKASVLTMLKVVNYLNLQHHSAQMQCGVSSDKVSINYLHCAVAAWYCSAYFTSIQYCELWLSQVSKGKVPITLEHHVRVNTPHVEEILQVLRESYAGLDNKDGLDGCGSSHLLESAGRIEHFKKLDKWEQVLRSYELELSDSSKTRALDGLLISMQMMGMEDLLMGLLETRESEGLQSYKYECGWRLASWDLLSELSVKKSPLPLPSDIPKTGIKYKTYEEEIKSEFHRNLFESIQSLKTEKYTEALSHINDARKHIINMASLTSMESCTNIYKPVSYLVALKQIEDLASVFKTSREGALTIIPSQWENSDLITQNSFKTIEPIMALRLTILKHFSFEGRSKTAIMGTTDKSFQAIAKIQLQLGQSAREAGMFAISEKYLLALKRTLELCHDPLMQIRLRYEEAQLFWAKGENQVAKALMESLIDHIDPNTLDKAAVHNCAEILTVYGHWIMQTHSESPKHALAKYFGLAVDLLDKYAYEKSSHEYLNAVKAMATYADEKYIFLCKYINSPCCLNKKLGASHSLSLAKYFEGSCQIGSDERRSIKVFKGQAKLDEKEIEECESDRDFYLVLALDSYVKYLTYSPEVDLEIVFRFVSLFLENHSSEECTQVEGVPLFKFVPVLPQLLPRVFLSGAQCSRTLKSIVERCALHHPHHILPNIFALAYSFKDLGNAMGSDKLITDTQKINQKGAIKMIEQLRKWEKLSDHINQLSIFWETIISLAYLPGVYKLSEGSTGPTGVLLKKLTNLTHVHIPTVELEVSPTGEYERIISVWNYVPKFRHVGGANEPKKIVCKGSDGNSYTQLIKGHDDLRQDAVMQQVFQLINNILKQNESARKRKLQIRTYKVVPLSHRSGIIEWCENTVSIGNYLQGYRHIVGAHTLYSPSDYPIRVCRNLMMDVLKSTKEVKLKVFRDICEHLQPVFRHYFTTKFPNPGIWYEMRQAYTKSVAVASIVGYILGLGDRHPHNILLDEISSEVIHIDLGISFERGKILPVPETVPFRLTRDIVDGMGISGVEGLFQRSCEVTMSLMRQYHQIILSILEVLIYDPLYIWALNAKFEMTEDYKESAMCISPTTSHMSEGEMVFASPRSTSPMSLSPSAKANTSNRSNKSGGSTATMASGSTSYAIKEESTQSAEKNDFAIRALARIESKLLGMENGTPASVEAQVERLIQEARDPETLCALFPGWQPYL